jgi:hypothetical protein
MREINPPVLVLLLDMDLKAEAIGATRFLHEISLVVGAIMLVCDATANH